MNTTDDYLTTHHPESFLLRPIDWKIFGHVGFSKSDSHAKKNTPRTRRFVGLLFGMAAACGVKPRKLVYFQNNEVKPETDFHHIHFLLGPHGLEKLLLRKSVNCSAKRPRLLDWKIASSPLTTPPRTEWATSPKEFFGHLKTARGLKSSPIFSCPPH